MQTYNAETDNDTGLTKGHLTVLVSVMRKNAQTMLQTFTGGLIGFNEACEMTVKREGNLVPVVMLDQTEGRSDNLVYAFFFRDLTGKCFDVVLNRSNQRRTFASADKLLNALQKAYPDRRGYYVPLMNSSNAVPPDPTEMVERDYQAYWRTA